MSKKQKTIGTASRPRRYDLPLNKGSGTGFLFILLALMTWLAMMALSGGFTPQAMTARWTSGLEGRLTVEIPATTPDKELLPPEDIKNLATQIAKMLNTHPDVADTHILSAAEIHELIAPWLGDAPLPGEMPLPALVTVTLKSNSSPETPTILEEKIGALTPQAHLDTHQEWLADLTRFTGALQFAALLLTGMIGLTTVTAIAGAIHSRMAIHHEEIELLHLMGAADRYIARQFQRHAFLLALKGGGAGLILGTLSLFLIGWLTGEMDINLLPEFRLAPAQITILALLPAIVALISTVTARQTVHHVLSRLP